MGENNIHLNTSNVTSGRKRGKVILFPKGKTFISEATTVQC
jgi:hypothetical protein